jgi:hypothetical protein
MTEWWLALDPRTEFRERFDITVPLQLPRAVNVLVRVAADPPTVARPGGEPPRTSAHRPDRRVVSK